MRWGAALVGLIWLTSCAANEHYQDLTETAIRGDRLYVSGTLNALTYDEIAEALDAHPALTTVVLEDIDGSIDDEINLQTALMIHEAGLDTYLPAHGVIESGAVDLFCAGHNRIAERGARIGVHSWADEDGAEGHALPRTDEGHQIYLDYFGAVDCPVSFYWFTLQAANADDIYYMTEQEWLTHKVVTEIR